MAQEEHETGVLPLYQEAEATTDDVPQLLIDPRSPIAEYFARNSEIYVKLRKLKDKVCIWSAPVGIFTKLAWVSLDEQGDRYYQRQRRAADSDDSSAKQWYFEMQQRIAHQLQERTAAFQFQAEEPLILDTCMTQGGFSQVVLELNPNAKISAVCLPERLDGYTPLLKHGLDDERVKIYFTDITNLGIGFGPQPKEVPAGFSADILFTGKQYDLVICDGQLQRNNQAHRMIKIESRAAKSLECSQLIFALNRLREGGTLIVLLHSIQAWNTIQLLLLMSKFAKIELFKHDRHHAIKNSFNMVAKEVQSDSAMAHAAIVQWKRDWHQCNFEPVETNDEDLRTGSVTEKTVEDMLHDFGKHIIKLAEPIWSIQLHALETTP